MAVEIDGEALTAARRRMVDGQIRPSDVNQTEIVEAMLWAPRERFLPKSKRSLAYASDMIEIAPGRFELEPRVLGKMIATLAPKPDELALVVGSGGGYAAAVLSKLCAAVIALEQDEALQKSAAEALSAVGVDTVISETGNLAEGKAQHAPYNVILVNGAVPAVGSDGVDPLEKIVSTQLAEGGRLVALRSSGAVGWCDAIIRTGEGWSGRRAFEATGPLLPGFELEKRFEF